MVKRLPALILILVLLLCTLTGCGDPGLPVIDLDESSLTGNVDAIGEDGTLQITVLKGDSHYDGPYQNSEGEAISGDVIFVSYARLKGSRMVSVGDTVTFTYHYTSDVAKFNGTPWISVDQLKVK